MKVGDRVQAKERTEIKGTVRSVKADEIWVELDAPIKGENQEGAPITIKEGYLNKKQFEQVFELIEESDWASIWDDSSS